MKILWAFQKTSLCIVSGVWLYTGSAMAQNSDALDQPTTKSETPQNPFDFVLQAAKSPEQLKRHSKSLQQVRVGQFSKDKGVKAKSSTLQYRKTFSGTSAQAQALRKRIIAKYGEPKSIRGKSHVWDIKNPNKGNGQADIVTIILKMEQNGSYELVMDRDRGADGRATWAAPRIEPAAAQDTKNAKSKTQKSQQFKPVLPPDND